MFKTKPKLCQIRLCACGLPSVVPPPTLGRCSGISAIRSASASDIECFVPKNFKLFGPSPASKPVRLSDGSELVWPRLTSAHPSGVRRP